MKNVWMLLTFFTLFLIGCSGSKKAPIKGVAVGKTQLIQDGIPHLMEKKNTKITLARKPFQIGFTNYPYSTANRTFYATQIAAFTDKKAFDVLQEGAKINDISFYQSGTGLAALGPYPKMWVDDQFAHHYIICEEGVDVRGKIVKRLPDGQVVMTWMVQRLDIGGQEISVSSSSIETLYIAVLQDKNLNKTIDEGELQIAELRFE